MIFSKKILLILVIPLFAFTIAHKYYVSVTQITYAEKDDALQITSRVFIDDMENLLKERYNVTGNLSTSEEYKLVDEYIEKYVREKFTIEINGKIKPFDFLGKKYDSDVLIFYIEVPKVNFSLIKSIQVENKVLTDLYDDQQNIVHLKIKEIKESFILTKSDAKGMLNL